MPALDRRRAGQLAEHDLQRSDRAQLVVPERHQGEHRQRLDPARQELDHVERSDIGPVDVFGHEHRRRPSRQLLGQPNEELVGAAGVRGEVGKLDAGGIGDVEERSERPGREQPLAGPPQYPGPSLRSAESGGGPRVSC